MNARFHDALARGPLVLDAALGTRLIAGGLDLAREDPAFWNLSRPWAVHECHARDVAAGADAIIANTFGANRAWLARWDRAHDAEAINRCAVAIARRAAGDRALVVGSIGPTAVSAPGAAREQASILADAGVDAILFETHRLNEAQSALQSVRGYVGLPILVSLIAWPAPVADSAQRLADLGAAVLGVNCQLGVAESLAMIEALSAATRLPLLAKPGAGRPHEAHDSPAEFARAVPALLACGVRLLGGCCGTTEAHVAALRAACYHHDARGTLRNAAPRPAVDAFATRSDA